MASSPAHSDGSHDSGDELERGRDGHDDRDGLEEEDQQNSSKVPAAKDKECQYCHQKFTSSSLGRHLDQFISKKKPDGIHNVDEIRRLRGGITRRTARSGHKKEQDEQEPHSQQQQPPPLQQQQSLPPAPPPPPRQPVQPGQHSPSPQYTLPSYSELVNKTATKEDVRFNRANWQATGVITDPTSIAPAPVAAAAAAAASPAINAIAGQKRSYSTYIADVPSSSNSETVRALELSLREVLDAIRIATKKAAPPSQPFDFDFVSQTFPFLCLALLQAPPTLFQSTPFATSNTIPLAAPATEQFQALRGVIGYVIDQWKWSTLSYIQRSSPPGTTIADELDNLNERAQTITESCLAHLDAAYQNFMSYSLENRQQLWTIELLRGYKTEQDRTKDAKATVERMKQEIDQVQQQLDHLSRCQWPREMALWPPERPTFDASTQDELRKFNPLRGMNSTPSTPSNGNPNDSADEALKHDRWDYDRLLSKWRRHVREDRARRTGVQPSPAVPELGPQHSPKSVPVSTPRFPSGLHKSATVPPDISGLAPPRPSSASAYQFSSGVGGGGGTAGSITSAEDSPRHSISNNGGGGSPSTLPPQGYGPGAVPPPPRSRPLGVVSDVDEYYGPRLMGFRRDPLR